LDPQCAGLPANAARVNAHDPHGDRIAPGRNGGHPLADVGVGVALEVQDREPFGVDLEDGEVELTIDADELGRKFLAIVEPGDEVPFEFARFGDDPAVGSDDPAEGEILLARADADGGLSRLGDGIAEGGADLRAVSEVGRRDHYPLQRLAEGFAGVGFFGGLPLLLSDREGAAAEEGGEGHDGQVATQLIKEIFHRSHLGRVGVSLVQFGHRNFPESGDS
jgi:hypothetical protein